MKKNSEIFSSKPKQIAKSISKIASQIFGDLTKVKLVSLGDQRIILDIYDNLKEQNYLEVNFIDSAMTNYFDENNQKILDKNRFIQNFYKYDVFIIGFKDGIKMISKELISNILSLRKQRPLFLIEGGLPGNINRDVSKINNLFLFDLNDLEEFFSHWKTDDLEKDNDDFFSDKIEETEQLSFLFKKLNLNLSQKKTFNKYLISFLEKNSGSSLKKKFFNFFQSFKD